MKRGGLNSGFREEIPLILDSYEDIFSDFDPRTFSQKALSGDFLLECKKASVDKKKIELKLFVPRKKRNLKKEVKIKRRLKEHFKKHAKEKKREIRKIKLVGTFWTVIGAVMMIVSAFFFTTPSSFFQHLVAVLIQPAGWFFLWEGLAKILITPKDKMPDYRFYKKMANSEISFLNI
jgi:hypothetical protein